VIEGKICRTSKVGVLRNIPQIAHFSCYCALWPSSKQLRHCWESLALLQPAELFSPQLEKRRSPDHQTLYVCTETWTSAAKSRQLPFWIFPPKMILPCFVGSPTLLTLLLNEQLNKRWMRSGEFLFGGVTFKKTAAVLFAHDDYQRNCQMCANYFVLRKQNCSRPLLNS